MPVMSRPLKRIVPLVGGRNAVSRLKQVVLPAPFGPINAWIWPVLTRKVTLSTATKPLNSRVSPSVSRMVSTLGPSPVRDYPLVAAACRTVDIQAQARFAAAHHGFACTTVSHAMTPLVCLRWGESRLQSHRLRRGLPLACSIVAALTVAGCGRWGDPVDPALDIPAAYRATATTAAAEFPSADWWTGFGSPQLNALIEQARASNFDIQAAIARVRQADAQVRIAGAPLLPTLNGVSSAGWQHVGINAGNTGGQVFNSNASVDIHDYSVGLSAAYQLDFWGHNLSRKQSLIASAEFSRFDQRTVDLTVVTNVANTWFTALALADRLDVARHNVTSSQQTLAVIK